MPEAVLEFKAKDGAWYSGIATFKQTVQGQHLCVHFEHFPEDEDELWPPDMFSSPIEVKKMIRPASQPLQDSQCKALRNGMFLCVACRHEASDCFEYYDARLQQMHRSEHEKVDGQEICSCQFEVEWLGGPLLHKRQFVTCGDICIRMTGDIEDDPVIREFVAQVKAWRASKMEGSKDPGEKAAVQTSKKRALPSVLPKEGGLNRHSQSTCRESSNATQASHHAPEDSLQGKTVRGASYGIGIDSDMDVDSKPKKRLHTLNDVLPAQNAGVPPIMESNEEHSKLATETRERPSADSLHAESSLIANKAAEQISSTLDEKNLHSSSFAKKKPSEPPLVDESSADNSHPKFSRRQSCSCAAHMRARSCIPLARLCCKGRSCQCDALSFIPVAPFHLASICSHSNECGHNTCKPSLSSQAGSKVAQFQVGCTLKSEDCTGDVAHPNTCAASNVKVCCEDLKSPSHSQFLLVQNLERNIIPSKALKAVLKVSSGALTVYVCPSLAYETTKKGYICYRDAESAGAAYLAFTTGNFVITSSEGRPWVVSHANHHQLESTHLQSIYAAAITQEEDVEIGKDVAGDLQIHQRGTEEYVMAVSRRRLFEAQQEKLQSCYEKFSYEERALEAELGLYQHLACGCRCL